MTRQTKQSIKTNQVKETVIVNPADDAQEAPISATTAKTVLEQISQEKHQKKIQGVVVNHAGAEPKTSFSGADNPDVIPSTSNQPDLQALISQAVAQAMQEREAQENEAKKQAEVYAQLEAAKAEAEAAKKEAENSRLEAEKFQSQLDNLSGALKLQGRVSGYNPNVLSQMLSRSDAMGPVLQSFLDRVNRAPLVPKSYQDSKAGQSTWMEPDSTVVDNLIREAVWESKQKTGCKFLNAKDFARLPLFQEYEDYLRRNGLFQGKGAPMLNAGAIAADIIGGFLTTLSAMMRFTHRGNYIWWQFAPVEMNFAAGDGDTVVVPRYALSATPTTLSSWELSGGGTFVPITEDRQGAKTGVVPVVLKEYGMGKNGVAPNYPFQVPNFVQQYSMISVLNIFDVNLMRNYMVFEDIAIRSLYAPTSVVYYNKDNALESTPTNLGSGDNGTLTVEFLRSLDSDMKAQHIPTYRDGRYVFVTDDYSLQQLRQSMSRVETDQFVQPTTEAEMINLTNILSSIDDIDRISGYHGVVGAFHIFSQNEFGMGAPGTPGVQNVTISGSATQAFRTSYAFGADAVARGMGMPMQIRSRSGEILWERAMEFIWVSHEAFAPLDVDPVGYSDTSDVPQQLRVIECRFSTTEL